MLSFSCTFLETETGVVTYVDCESVTQAYSDDLTLVKNKIQSYVLLTMLLCIHVCILFNKLLYN